MSPAPTKTRKGEAAKVNPPDKLHYDAGWRETVEAVAMAVILALLFRAFIAEPFVIPTGSMAPTLMGRHKDVVCPECGYRYQANASKERDHQNVDTNYAVVNTACAVCRYRQQLDEQADPNQGSFSGDRIIVSKFAYDLAEPRRWDVIVFKYPGDAVQNYIKRLVGLPGETLRIVGGNVYAKKGDSDFKILRKPPHKLDTLLQIVHDNDYQEEQLLETVWPPRWRAATGQENNWKHSIDRKTIAGENQTAEPVWVRYHHVNATQEDWQKIQGTPPTIPRDAPTRLGELVTDFYAYNAYSAVDMDSGALETPQVLPHWVDDLALDVTLRAEEAKGAVLLDLVRGGVHHTCRIDLATGEATLSRRDAAGSKLPFTGEDGVDTLSPKAKTAVRGKGTYRLRLSNVDHETLLWVNGSVVDFDAPTSYRSEDLIHPAYSKQDAGDLEPAGVGLEGTNATLTHLRLLRDKYYLALNEPFGGNDYTTGFSAETLRDPSKWSQTDMFDRRRTVQFKLSDGQYFPMGDNSPQSADARTWNGPHFVERDLLIGKAVVIYWPHTWNRPIPFLPNFQRMGLIR
jgi:signal peptidase I